MHVMHVYIFKAHQNKIWYIRWLKCIRIIYKSLPNVPILSQLGLNVIINMHEDCAATEETCKSTLPEIIRWVLNTTLFAAFRLCAWREVPESALLSSHPAERWFSGELLQLYSKVAVCVLSCLVYFMIQAHVVGVFFVWLIRLVAKTVTNSSWFCDYQCWNIVFLMIYCRKRCAVLFWIIVLETNRYQLTNQIRLSLKISRYLSSSHTI
jgi:hypothetical protein